LAELGTLIERVSAAGLPVTSQISGTPAELPAGLDLAAYRVVQEALTNVLRHAGQARTGVRVDYRPGELLIEVADDGPPAEVGPPRDGGGTGRGLLGLRERLALYGGDFDAGRRPSGGWRVRARIPVEAAAPGDPAPLTDEEAGPAPSTPGHAGHVPAARR